MDTATGDDVIHLEVGQPNFATPDPVIDAACKAARNRAGLYTRYTPNMGYASLRSGLVLKLKQENGIKVSEDAIMITPGSNYAIMIVLSALLNAGDEVLVPDPGYVNYTSLPPQFGGKVIYYPLHEADDFAPRIESIAERITPATKMIVHNSPSNPTGAVASESYTRELVELAHEHDLYIFSDEAYEHIVFEGRHVSPGRFDDEGRVISIFSFSKSFAMTGWRVAYTVTNEAIAHALEKQQELYISCAPSISQKAAEAALNNDEIREYVRDMVRQYRSRRDLAVDILRKNNLLAYTPHGAFYILINITGTILDSDTIADRLLKEQRVAVAPGATFGRIAGQYIRVSLAADDRSVEEGLKRICRFIKTNA
jgi:aspartate aminotransferase/aminotransferase